MECKIELSFHCLQFCTYLELFKFIPLLKRIILKSTNLNSFKPKRCCLKEIRQRNRFQLSEFYQQCSHFTMSLLRWPFLCKAHALSWLRHHAGSLPTAVREEDGRPALHPRPHGGDLLVRRYFIGPGYAAQCFALHSLLQRAKLIAPLHCNTCRACVTTPQVPP